MNTACQNECSMPEHAMMGVLNVCLRCSLPTRLDDELVFEKRRPAICCREWQDAESDVGCVTIVQGLGGRYVA